jgi:ferredoxin
MATVSVDPDLCLEAGQCARLIPHLFMLDDSGPVRLAGDRPTGPTTVDSADTEQVHHAAATCPAAAITVEE